MATVIVSGYKVAKFLDGGGGHFWVYMQYIHALRRAGCDVYWLEQVRCGSDGTADERTLAAFLERARAFGLDGRVLLYCRGTNASAPRRWLGTSDAAARATLARADLLLNFHYAIEPDLLGCCRRTALMDIDPGLLQLWMSTGELSVAPHDVYFSIGESIAAPRALAVAHAHGGAAEATARSGAGTPHDITWVHSPPPVCLELWPAVSDPGCEAFTTVSGWWSGRWIRVPENGSDVLHENTKRAAFLPFLDLPRRTAQPLELALDLADDDDDARRLLEERGWRVQRARAVAGTAETYRAYIQRSRGEWSVAKPAYTRFRNAWVSDRTPCYLASGKPAVVQDTGPSAFLPSGEGLFRFRTVDEAAAALDAVNANYARHCRAARELAEAYFDATKVVARILHIAAR